MNKTEKPLVSSVESDGAANALAKDTVPGAELSQDQLEKMSGGNDGAEAFIKAVFEPGRGKHPGIRIDIVCQSGVVPRGFRCIDGSQFEYQENDE